MALLENLIDIVRGEQRAALQVERDHVAGTELALLLHVLGLVVPHSGLGGDGENTVAGDAEARRAQAVAIQRAQRVAAVGQYHPGRAVPRLHVHRVVLVEGAQIRVERIEAVPGRRHQQPHGMQRIEPAHQQHLEHVVEALRVRAAHRDQRQHLLQVGQQRGAQQRSARRGPVAVALDGVDLAVVGEIAIRVRKAPLRQGVGGEALMEHGHRALEARIGEVRIELRQVLRHHHALEDDGAGGETGHVEHRIPGQGLLGEAARHEQAPVERSRVDIGGPAVHEQLLDERARLEGFGAAGGWINRHHSPAGDLQSLTRQLGGERQACGASLLRIVRQKDQPRSEARTQLDPGLRGHRAQEAFRSLQQQAATVAGLAVGGDRAAMREAIEGGHGGAHQPVARRIVQARDQAETATVALVRVLMES